MISSPAVQIRSLAMLAAIAPPPGRAKTLEREALNGRLGLAYRGPGGSFGNMRHLWLLLGLFLAAQRLASPKPA